MQGVLEFPTGLRSQSWKTQGHESLMISGTGELGGTGCESGLWTAGLSEAAELSLAVWGGKRQKGKTGSRQSDTPS